MVYATTTVLVGTLGSSGCLDARTVVPDDTNLTELIPPVILDGDSVPRPGEVVTLVAAATTPRMSATFKLAVATATGRELVVRWYVNRSLRCSAAAQDCGIYTNEDRVKTSDGDAAVPALSRAEATEELFFAAVPPARCYAIDAYVSSAFLQGGDVAANHLPVRSGDIAHVRWYVVTKAAATDRVDTDACIQFQ